MDQKKSQIMRRELSREYIAWCTSSEREYYSRVVEAALNHKRYPGPLDS